MVRSKRNLVIVVVLLLMFCGCAGKSATQQVMDQTDDKTLILKATYVDAISAIIAVQEAYVPYQKVIEANHPEIGEKILGCFVKVRELRKKWQAFGGLDLEDREALQDNLREITIQMALALEERDE